jgi:hypothetical protein
MVWGGIWHGERRKLVPCHTSSTGRKRGVTTAIYAEQTTRVHLKAGWQRLKAIWGGYGLPWIIEDNARAHTAKKARQVGFA